jgi:hypothetical protein
MRNNQPMSMDAVAITLEEVDMGEKGGANGVVWAKMDASYLP